MAMASMVAGLSNSSSWSSGCDARTGSHRRPARLFCGALFSSLVLWSSTVCLLTVANVLFLPLYLVGIPYGLRGWYKLFEQSTVNGQRRRRMDERYSMSKFQFRIVDMCSGAIAFGLVMSALTRIPFLIENTDLRIVVCIVAAFFETMAFLIAMDVCRRSAALQSALPRFLFMLAVMSFTAVLPIFPVIAMAWASWQHAMWRSKMPI